MPSSLVLTISFRVNPYSPGRQIPAFSPGRSRGLPLCLLAFLAFFAIRAQGAGLLPKEAPGTSGSLTGYAGSGSCRACHENFYQRWSTSFHGLAMQPYTAELAKTKLTPQAADIVAGMFSFRADVNHGVVIEHSPNGEKSYPITQVMGGKNVYYFLTPLDRGWLQTLPVAYDVRRKEWFDTTASAMRHFGDRRDEALYWKDRPLTFNTSCFNCHVSQLSKNYDLKTDSYHSTWTEPGINCETCHGPSAEHIKLFHSLGKGQPAPGDIKLISFNELSIEQRNSACAPCHAKMSAVTVNFKPRERYFDHFDLVTYENPDFYADGRDLGENYTYTGWRRSPCVKSGKLDCIQCHTSSGRYRFQEPATANDACLPCHSDLVKNAPAHTHHKADTPGNQCISCHMPMTEFGRMRRSDHSMLPPTPAATIACQSPNACNICHSKEDANWSDKFVRKWYKRDYQKPVLERAALLAAARKGDWTKLPSILAYLTSKEHEEILTTSLLRLLTACPSDDKWPVLRKLTEDASPLVRSAAAEALQGHLDEANINALLKATGDDYRLVRVRAASTLAALPPEGLPAEQQKRLQHAMNELIDSLKSQPDEMSSHYTLGNLHMTQGRAREAVEEFETAMKLQPEALPPHINAALAYNTLGQNEKAEASLRRALALNPASAEAHLNLGMLLAEMKRLVEAEQSFRAAFRADPKSAQAAYNLAILTSTANPAESLEWCSRAATLGPENPRYGYTYAFYLDRAGNLDQALKVIRTVRQSHPEHEDSAMLEHALLQKQNSTRK